MAMASVSVSHAQAAVAVLESAVPFSTRVDGKNYQANVVRNGDVYIAREPQIPAEASGASTLAAEEALSNRINCLV